MKKQRKRLLVLSLTFIAVTGVFAQGNGTAGINEATQMVTSYFEPATQLIYAIGAVVGLIGGVKVYNKFSSGDRDCWNSISRYPVKLIRHCRTSSWDRKECGLVTTASACIRCQILRICQVRYPHTAVMKS